jgi:hypothetical protein
MYEVDDPTYDPNNASSNSDSDVDDHDLKKKMKARRYNKTNSATFKNQNGSQDDTTLQKDAARNKQQTDTVRKHFAHVNIK